MAGSDTNYDAKITLSIIPEADFKNGAGVDAKAVVPRGPRPMPMSQRPLKKPRLTPFDFIEIDLE